MKKCDINNMIKFIRKIYNTNKLISLYEPRFFGNEKKYLLKCVDSTFVSSVGEFVNQFEYEMSYFTQTNSKGIMTRPIWRLMYKLPMYKNYYRDEQKNAEYLESRIINIPSSALL